MLFECPYCAEQITVPANMVGGQMYCPECGQLMVIPNDARTLPPGAPLQSIQFAGFWIRFVAFLIDHLVISLPMLMAVSIAPPLCTLVGVIYKGVCLANWKGQTVGKRVCGIKVVGEDFRPLTSGQAWGRSFAEILSTMIMCFGYLMVGFTRRKQALHDRLANTVHIYS